MTVCLEDLTPIAIVQSDTTFYDPPIRAITISAAGNLVVENEMGDEVTLVCPSTATMDEEGGGYPFTWVCGKVRRVKADTTIDDANLVGHCQPQRTRNLSQSAGT